MMNVSLEKSGVTLGGAGKMNIAPGKSVVYFEKIGDVTFNVSAGADTDIIYFLEKQSAKGVKINLNFEGDGSRLRLILLTLVRKDEVLEIEINSNGNRSHNVSHVLCKAVVFENGRIKVVGNMGADFGTAGNDLYFAHHSLLLSERSEAVSFPGLVINTDDVKAAHAASLGKIDDEVMFLLS